MLSQLEAGGPGFVMPVQDHPAWAREGVTLGEAVPSIVSNSPGGTELVSQWLGDSAGPEGGNWAIPEGRP